MAENEQEGALTNFISGSQVGENPEENKPQPEDGDSAKGLNPDLDSTLPNITGEPG